MKALGERILNQLLKVIKEIWIPKLLAVQKIIFLFGNFFLNTILNFIQPVGRAYWTSGNTADLFAPAMERLQRDNSCLFLQFQ